MSLHDRIMALPLVAPYAGRDYEAVELRNHASEIGREADELMEEMGNALQFCADQLSDEHESARCLDNIAEDSAMQALINYKTWKEHFSEN